MTRLNLLQTMGRDGIRNSERWFPRLHARGPEHLVLHLALGIGGEAGEAVDVVKKAHRRWDGEPVEHVYDLLTQYERDDLAEELVDALTYMVNLAWLCGIDLHAEWQAKQRVCEQRWGAER